MTTPLPTQPVGQQSSGPQPLGGYDPTYRAFRTGPAYQFLDEAGVQGAYAAGSFPTNVVSGQFGPTPRYFDGDQFAPMSWDVNAIIDLQSRLHAAGLLSKYRPGIFSEDEISAYSRLLAMANGAGTSADQYLNYLTSVGAGEEIGADKTRAPLTISLTNENDIRAVLQAGAQQVFGKYVSENDIAKFVNSFHQQETTAQTDAYNQAGSEGGTITAPPSTAAGMNREFTDQFTAEHPTEARASIFSSKLNDIISSLIGPKL